MSHIFSHIPVLLEEVLDVLDPKPGDRVLDCTVGLGGHAAAFLEYIGPDGRLIGLDADDENLQSIECRMQNAEWRNINLRHFEFDQNKNSFDIVFADLGLSSPHVDDPKRGFTYREDVPLDLRFDRSKGETAAELIARMSEAELAMVLKEYGEIRSAKKFAQILKERPIRTTFDIKYCVPHILLPQMFQALRIAVNDELGALNVLLEQGPQLLRPGGRLGIISYHSLEDRMVKRAFRAFCTPKKDPVTGAVSKGAPFLLLTKKAIHPSDSEVKKNPRARSAKFRALRAQ